MKKIAELWTEGELLRKLELPEPKKERSKIVSEWIRKGLKHIEIAGRRFFREQEVVSYFNREFEGV